MNPDTLLAQANPVPEPDAAVDETQRDELLRELLATPVEPTRRPRHGGRRLAIAVTAAAAIAGAGVALAPSLRDSPGVIARAAAALNQPDTILHFEARFRGEGRKLTHTVEVWQTAGARQVREVYDDGLNEYVEDLDAKVILSYQGKRNELIRQTTRGVTTRPQRATARSLGASGVTDDLARLLDRARRGSERIRLIGETTVRGIPVYELRIDMVFRVRRLKSGEWKPDRLTLSRRVYIDRERFLPVRIIDPGVGPMRATTIDYVVAERLPRTPETEALLRMSPHPGAKERNVG
jgi:hypothetical protein